MATTCRRAVALRVHIEKSRSRKGAAFCRSSTMHKSVNVLFTGTYPLPARNALFRIKALVFQLVVPNSRMPNNLTKRLTHPTSSSYYATQHVQSPFLRKKAVGEIGPDSRHGRITINGTMSQFSCKLTVRSSFWDTKANKAAGKSLEAQRINRMSSSSAHLQV